MATNLTRLKSLRETKEQKQHDLIIANKLLKFRGAPPIKAIPNKVQSFKKPTKATKPLSESIKEIQAVINSFNNKRKSVKTL